MSNTKLGLLVLWPTFWTGFPIKLAVCLLLLAAHVHPWEGSGLLAILVISIPIDIWALGLCARTVFLERLRIRAPQGVGMTLWWQWTVYSLIYLPILYLAVGGVKATAKDLTVSTIEFFEQHVFAVIPIAEKISIELVMWGTPTVIVLILLLLGWLYGLGALTKRQVNAGTPAEGSFEDVVRRWDLMRIPGDQPLLLTSLTAIGVLLVFIFWGLIPVTTPHPHEDYQYTKTEKVEPPIIPSEVIKKTEQILAQASLVIETLEKDKGVDGQPTEAKKEPAEKPGSQTSKDKRSTATASTSRDESHTHPPGEEHAH